MYHNPVKILFRFYKIPAMALPAAATALANFISPFSPPYRPRALIYYTYICVCVYIFVYTLFIYIYIYVCVYIYIYICIYSVYIYARTAHQTYTYIYIYIYRRYILYSIV